MNVIALAGNVGRDSDIKYLESGTIICTNSLAVRKTKDETLWIDIKAFGKTAETMGEYVKKGSKIAITGKFDIETWNDRETNDKRSKPVVLIDRLTLMDSPKSDSGSTAGGSRF
jgi:single-strand DNA-binding protein